MNYLITLLTFFFFSLAMANDVVVKENEKKTLEFIEVNNKLVLTIEKLTLNKNSIIFIPEYSNKEIILNINELIVNGKSVIVQTFGNNFSFDYLRSEMFDFYWKGRLPKASDGKTGAEGMHGRSSTPKLTLNININKLDQLYVLLIAESGGKGGTGLKGKNGLDSACSYGDGGGDGGDGGDGSAGGAPGRSGNIIINWTSKTNLKLIGKTPIGLFARSLPGMVGFPGDGGAGGSAGEGKGCFPLYTRGSGNNGKPGKTGPARLNSDEHIFFGSKGFIEINHKGEL